MLFGFDDFFLSTLIKTFAFICGMLRTLNVEDLVSMLSLSFFHRYDTILL